jgi:hypothetical protein
MLENIVKIGEKSEIEERFLDFSLKISAQDWSGKRRRDLRPKSMSNLIPELSK